MTLDEWVQSGRFATLARGVNLSSVDEKTIYWKAVDRNRGAWERRVIDQVKDRFREERRAVVAALRSSGPDAVGAVVVNASDRWRDLLFRIYLAVGEFFGRMILEHGFKGAPLSMQRKEAVPDEQLDLMTREILAWIQMGAGSKIAGINRTTLKKIKRQLAEGIAEGESIPKLAKRIDRLYLRQIIPNRSRVIARTEIISASNLGSRAGALATGLTLDHEWIATRDGRTRDAHASVDGQTKPITTAYSVAGEQLMFPGDSSLGASASNTVQCRCTEGFLRRH